MMKLKVTDSPWLKIAIAGFSITAICFAIVAIVTIKKHPQLTPIQNQQGSTSIQTKNELTRYKNLQQEFEALSKNLQEKDDELQKQRDAIYILSGLIGPGRLLMSAPLQAGLPHTFKVSKGGSFTVVTGCGGGPVYKHNDKFTVTKINTDQQTRAWSIEMKRSNTFQQFSYDEETKTDKLISSRTTQHDFIITSDDPINTFDSGTDRLVPTLVTPDAVYFVRAQYSC